MTTITTDLARGGEASKNHRVFKILTLSLAMSLSAMMALLMFG